MQYFTAALFYVIGDQYFWFSMSFTTIIGMYVSAAIYDGELHEIKKFMIGLCGYASLIFMTTGARIFPVLLETPQPGHTHQPLAGLVTIILVTLFYLLGMYWGVKISNHAHKQSRGVK